MAQLGGRVEAGHHAEFGRAFVAPERTRDLPIFAGLFESGREEVWMSHGDRVTALAPGFEVLGASPNAPFAIVADLARAYFAVQFHPEVHHTPNGARLLKNFTDLAGFTGDWSMAAYKDEAIARIRAQVGAERVICGLSGGVDSSVAAVLIHEAIGDQLTCVFVDTGLMRAGRGRRGGHPVPRPLQHPADPRRRERPLPRRARRRHRPRDQAQDHRPAVHRGVRRPRRPRSATPTFLAQGTLYPDVIESVSFSGGPSVTIKSHHNVGGLPERMKLKLVEPLRELFKDEVRALGRELGLPAAFVGRHPFPGPRPRDPLPRRGHPREARDPAPGRRGLSRPDPPARPLRRDLAGLRGAAAGPHRRRDGRRPHLRPRLRAARGDQRRRHDRGLLSRSTTSFLSETATRIINEVKGINRVTYDVTSKPPGTIEWE